MAQANQTQIPVLQSDSDLVTVQQNVNKVLRNLHNQIEDISLTNGIEIDVGGTSISTVPELNFIPGTGISISGVNNIPLNRVDLTITNSGAGTGSVTSVALADGSTTPIFTITGSPVTTSGTLTETLKTQNANTVFAGPTSGGASQPSFRLLTAADIPFSASASPGFSWGRSGNIIANTYLLNDTVPSNVTGRIVPLVTGTITKAVIACGIASTFTVKVQKRSGVSFTDLFSVSVVSSRTSVTTQTQAVTSGDELAVLVSAGSTDDVVVSLIMVGAD